MNVALASKKPRALITGAEGFTGQFLAQELSLAGYEVIGTTYEGHPSDNLIALDLCNRARVVEFISEVKPDVVAHLAAISFVNENDAFQMYQTNFMGTFNLLDALGRLSLQVPRSILLCSSATVYGNNPLKTLSEKVFPDPVNEYAVSKYAMEKMAKLWMTRLPVFVVRPFNYTGVGQHQKFLIPKIVQHFKEKKSTIELGNLDVWREFGDVRSVVKAYAKLLEICPTGQTLNICTGQSYSLREVIKLCEDISNHPIQVTVNPQFVRENEVHVLQGDPSLLKNVIGEWEAYTLKETLTWMLEHEG